MGAHRYTPAEKERGLRQLALCYGSARRAERELDEQGIRIPERTLRDWRNEDPAHYDRIREQLVPLIEKYIAQSAEDAAVRLGAKNHELLDALDTEAIGTMQGKDLANAIKSVAVAQAVLVDKVQGQLRGRPTLIEHRISASEQLSKLAARIGSVIDSTAEPIEDARELPAG